MKKIITLIMSIITLSGYSQELFIGDSNPLHVFNDAVFYVNGTATGDANYHRTLDTTNWYLISSPLSGQIFNDAYVSANNIASGQGIDVVVINKNGVNKVAEKKLSFDLN